MSYKRLGNDFAVSRGNREFEFFMLPDKARRECQAMREKAENEVEQIREQQKARHEHDVLSAKREIVTERPTPQLTPFMARRHKRLNAHQVQELVEQLVEARNEKQVSDLRHAHLQREDDFFAKEKEERLRRQATERERKPRIDIERDIDHSR